MDFFNLFIFQKKDRFFFSKFWIFGIYKSCVAAVGPEYTMYRYPKQITLVGIVGIGINHIWRLDSVPV